ncbi:hypothetical protein AGMMS50267_18040 [Spirochaetia bacterium]|nr:hypothetical protein AGMMS50267_18040 [Spirochaetia bacterium]
MKARVLITICALTLMTLPALAQEATPARNGASPYYYVNVPVQKIYTCDLGYVVTYRRGALGTAQAYIPMEWFNGSGSKGEAVRLASRSTWPFLTVYYKDGEFSHVRIYLHSNRTHESWGYIPPGQNLNSRFEGVEGIKLEY